MKYYYLKRHKGIFKYFQHSKTKYGYRFRYYKNHKQHEKSKRGFDTLTNAINSLNSVRDLKDNNTADITLRAWCNNYLNMIKPPIRKISTYKSYQHLLNEHILTTLGNVKLSQLTLNTYQQQLNNLLKQGLSRRTVIATNARVQTVINYAVKNQYLKTNPIRFATIPMANMRPKKLIMNKRQLHKFNQNLSKHSLLCRVIYTALEKTGMRCGEVLGLKWSDINFNNQIIHIQRTRDEYGLRKPKTIHSNRKIIIPDSLTNLLKQYQKQCIKQFQVEDNSLVILGKHGKPLIPNIVPNLLKRLLIESGLKNMVNRFTPHSFRHQFASKLIGSGVNPIAVSRMLGHSDPSITLKIYSQLSAGTIPNIKKYLK